MSVPPKEPGTDSSQPRFLTRLLPNTGPVGVLSAVALAVVANLFAARYDQRWDLTTDARYTPSPELKTLLKRLPRPTTAVVLLGRGDPLTPSIEQLLTSYLSATHQLTVDWVDPDRDPARYLAKQSELGIRQGHSDDGLVTADALLVLVSGSRKYYLTPEDITGLDPEHSDGGASFEHAFAVGLKSLLRDNKPEVCFTTGHRELSVTDQSPIGLSRFKERLEHDALSTRIVDLTVEEPKSLVSCKVLVVAAPDVPLSTIAVSKLSLATAQTSNLLLLGGVIPSSEGKLQSAGFEPLARLGGISLEPNITIELDENFRLPNLFGETFFATPAEHPINRGLLRGGTDSPLRVVVALAQSQSSLPGGPARPLLRSSEKSIVLTDVSHLSPENTAVDSANAKSQVVAMAGLVERPNAQANRVVVLPTNIVQNRSFDSPALVVTQAFADSVVSWLTAGADETVEITPRAERPLGLELSEQEMTELVRYVLVVMPSAVLLLGLAVYLRRRRDGRVRPHSSGDGGGS